MFTGLIEEIGIIKSISSSAKGKALTVSASFCSEKDGVKIGSSISINGACQTVIKLDENTFTVEAMNETIKHTNFKELKEGSKVNIERAMKINDRFDGHIVSGHIDTTAELESILPDGFSEIYRFRANTDLIALKGSVSINGVSLTISNVGKDFFEVSLIPHTIKNTNLEFLKPSDTVNIEYDMLARYVEKLIGLKHNTSGLCVSKNKPDSRITKDFLAENGF